MLAVNWLKWTSCSQLSFVLCLYHTVRYLICIDVLPSTNTSHCMRCNRSLAVRQGFFSHFTPGVPHFALSPSGHTSCLFLFLACLTAYVSFPACFTVVCLCIRSDLCSLSDLSVFFTLVWLSLFTPFHTLCLSRFSTFRRVCVMVTKQTRFVEHLTTLRPRFSGERTMVLFC